MQQKEGLSKSKGLAMQNGSADFKTLQITPTIKYLVLLLYSLQLLLVTQL